MSVSEQTTKKTNTENEKYLDHVPLLSEWFNVYVESNNTGQMTPVALNAGMGLTVLESLLNLEDDSSNKKVDWEYFLHSQFSNEQIKQFDYETTKAHLDYGLPIISEGAELAFIPTDPKELQAFKSQVISFLSEAGKYDEKLKRYVPLRERQYKLRKDGILIMPQEATRRIWENAKSHIFDVTLDFVDWAEKQSNLQLTNIRDDHASTSAGFNIYPSLTSQNTQRLQEFTEREEFKQYRTLLLGWYEAIKTALYKESISLLLEQMANFDRFQGGTGETRPTPQLNKVNEIAEEALKEANKRLGNITGIKADEAILNKFLDDLSSRKEFFYEEKQDEETQQTSEKEKDSKPSQQ